MEALNELVKCGKVRAIGVSAMYGYQFHNMQIIARDNHWTLFQLWKIITTYFIVKMKKN